ncbi:MAG TPA: prevent-host-death protein, partial [Firmicutes bacterium]|nr:prevent-host-death protein [Bacillota bacterium]
KLNLYLKSGVSEYWIVDPDNKTVVQYTFTQDREIESMQTFGEKETVNSTYFTGLTVPMPEVFTEVG